MPASISWPELIVLMAYGDGSEDRISGGLHVRDVQDVADDLSEHDFVGDDGSFEDHPERGRVCVHESRRRVHRRGPFVRLETVTGRWTAIFGAATTWIRATDEDVPTAYPRATSSFGWAGANLAQRLPASRWEGNDFTKLTGPIAAVERIGRPAWAFELAPPSHKPYPVQMVVDAATGFVLREGNAGFGSFTEWTSLQIGVELPDELFVWGGPSRPPEDRRAEHERDLAQRQQWLAGRNVAAVLTSPLRLMPHEWDDESGRFHASFESRTSGSLVRRPRSDEPWPDLDQMNWPHHYRWSDTTWDWFMGSMEPLEDNELAALREQLARST